MEPMQAGDLAIRPQRAPGVPKLYFHGKSNAREPSTVIGPYLERAFQFSASDGDAVEMHFEELQYFNSSTIAALVAAIQMARARGLRLSLFYSASLTLQRLSFDALRVFANGDGLLELRTV